MRLVVSIYLSFHNSHSFPTAGEVMKPERSGMEWNGARIKQCENVRLRFTNNVAETGQTFILNLRIALHFISWESTAVMVDGC